MVNGWKYYRLKGHVYSVNHQYCLLFWIAPLGNIWAPQTSQRVPLEGVFMPEPLPSPWCTPPLLKYLLGGLTSSLWVLHYQHGLSVVCFCLMREWKISGWYPTQCNDSDNIQGNHLHAQFKTPHLQHWQWPENSSAEDWYMLPPTQQESFLHSRGIISIYTMNWQQQLHPVLT